MQRRADKVHAAEYASTAIGLDRAYCGTTAGSRPGPSGKRLVGLGPCPAPWYWATTVSVNTFIEELLSTALLMMRVLRSTGEGCHALRIRRGCAWAHRFHALQIAGNGCFPD